ncbi:MAG: ABC transporter permease, partial [Oscillospiraceae bacterium]|nr:ABC transporter permease [Oscillospiraceae bacterium]
MLFSIVAGMFIIMSFASPHFLSRANIFAVLLSLSFEAFIGVAMMNLMICGGFDMSVGSIVGFSGSVVAMMMKLGAPVLFAVLVATALGACIGVFNGFIVAKVGINPFVTTLASLSLFRGLTMIVTGGRNISPLPDSFNAIGQTQLFGVLQLPILYTLSLVAIGDVLLRKSSFFRQSYYIGGNEKAARLSGIPVDRMKIFSFMLTGLFAGMTGVIMTSRLGSASTTSGTGLELRVITAVIIGGASLAGGEGTVVGAFLGS